MFTSRSRWLACFAPQFFTRSSCCWHRVVAVVNSRYSTVSPQPHASLRLRSLSPPPFTLLSPASTDRVPATTSLLRLSPSPPFPDLCHLRQGRCAHSERPDTLRQTVSPAVARQRRYVRRHWSRPPRPSVRLTIGNVPFIPPASLLP